MSSSSRMKRKILQGVVGMNRTYYALEAHQIPKPEPILAAKPLSLIQLLKYVEAACQQADLILIRMVSGNISQPPQVNGDIEMKFRTKNQRMLFNLIGFKLWDPRPSIYRKFLTVTKLLDAVEDACRRRCHIISIRRIEPEVRKK